MKRSQIYRNAAEKVHSGEERCSCLAIEHICSDGWEWSNEAKEYVALFTPKPDTPIDNLWGHNWAGSDAGRTQCRVLALLFMSEIAKDSE